MSKMFKSVTETWNIVTGCLHGCTYCYARPLAKGRLRSRYLANKDIIPRPPKSGQSCPEIINAALNDPFYPRFWRERLDQTFKPGLVFVVDMGDLFGDWVPSQEIQLVIDRIKQFPQTDFLFCTKNPRRYLAFDFPLNAILGTTLETDIPGDFTIAPTPEARWRALMLNCHSRKFISIEPIMDFTQEPLGLYTLARWANHLRPEIVEVGADNYGNNLPEPLAYKVRQLLEELRKICPKVVEKDGLERLLKNG